MHLWGASLVGGLLGNGFIAASLYAHEWRAAGGAETNLMRSEEVHGMGNKDANAEDNKSARYD